MNLTILPGAATDDAKKIDEIVKEIDNSMKELDTAIKGTIPSGIETQWSLDFESEWRRLYSGEIQGAMVAMAQSAENLRKAVEAALEYNK